MKLKWADAYNGKIACTGYVVTGHFEANRLTSKTKLEAVLQISYISGYSILRVSLLFW